MDGRAHSQMFLDLSRPIAITRNQPPGPPSEQWQGRSPGPWFWPGSNERGNDQPVNIGGTSPSSCRFVTRILYILSGTCNRDTMGTTHGHGWWMDPGRILMKSQRFLNYIYKYRFDSPLTLFMSRLVRVHEQCSQCLPDWFNVGFHGCGIGPPYFSQGSSTSGGRMGYPDTFHWYYESNGRRAKDLLPFVCFFHEDGCCGIDCIRQHIVGRWPWQQFQNQMPNVSEQHTTTCGPNDTVRIDNK